MCTCCQRSFCFLRSSVFDLIILVLFSHFVGEQKVVAFISFCRRSREYKISRSLLLLFGWLCIIGSGAGCSSTADRTREAPPKDRKPCCGCGETKPTDELTLMGNGSYQDRDESRCRQCAFQPCATCNKPPEEPGWSVKQIKDSNKKDGGLRYSDHTRS